MVPNGHAAVETNIGCRPALAGETSQRRCRMAEPPKPTVILETPRDPDGHLIEVGQTTDPEGDWSPAHWPASTPAQESE